MSESADTIPRTRILNIANLKQKQEEQAVLLADGILADIEKFAKEGKASFFIWENPHHCSLMPRIIELLIEANCPAKAVFPIKRYDDIVALQIQPFWAQ